MLPPLAMFVVELLAGFVSETLRRGLHLALVTVLVGAVILQVFELEQTLPAFALALALGAGAAALYANLAAVRSFLSVLSPAPIVFLVIFLTLSDVSRLVFADDPDVQAAAVASRAPVVLIVFDELPVTSLLGPDGKVDARMYPNFARLASQSSWFRNTTTVHADTPYAVPAIMDGRLPRKDRLPVAADHPQSIFSLLGGDYSMHVREDATAICPRQICRENRLPGFRKRMEALWDDLSLVYLHQVLPDDLERELPSVSESWGDFNGESQLEDATVAAARVERIGVKRRETKGHRKRRLTGNLNQGRPARFANFVAGIRGGGRPRLHFLHTLLPHVPLQYLPSGRAYRDRPGEDLPGLNSSVGFHVQFLVEQGYQRHLLQLGATDRLLGVMFERLRRLGLYDRALIAVVADHGASFQRGHDRRWVRAGNIQDIAPVPFFLKAPGQRKPWVTDKPLRTVDVLPTIADVLDIRIPWRIDGRSGFAATIPAQRKRRVLGKDLRYSVSVDVPGYGAARAAALRTKSRLFARGLFGIGPNQELVGRRVRDFSVAPATGATASFIDPGRYRRVDPDTGIVPVHVVGRLRGGTPGGGKAVALAVNGRIEATGFTFSLDGNPEEDFAVFLPERALRRGRNRLELLWVQGPDRLQSLGRTG